MDPMAIVIVALRCRFVKAAARLQSGRHPTVPTGAISCYTLSVQTIVNKMQFRAYSGCHTL